MTPPGKLPNSSVNSARYQFVCETPNTRADVDLLISMPKKARGVVHLIDGSENSQFNERSRYLSQSLLQNGFGTCLDKIVVKDIPLLPNYFHSKDLRCEYLAVLYQKIFDYLRERTEVAFYPRCILASGAGSPIALSSASAAPSQISAIVISGGRLSNVLPLASKNTIPTMFILGGQDRVAEETTRAAFAAARGPKKFHIIEGAGHLLREPGATEEIAFQSSKWFQEFL